MGAINRETLSLGDLVIAAFDSAAALGAQRYEVSHLATRAVMNVLRRGDVRWRRRARSVAVTTHVVTAGGDVRDGGRS